MKEKFVSFINAEPFRTSQLARNVEMNNRLNAMLAGIKPRKLTRAEKLEMEVDSLILRLENAAKVLDGKADICED